MKKLKVIYMDSSFDIYFLEDDATGPTMVGNQYLIYGVKNSSSGKIITSVESVPIAYIPFYNVRKVLVIEGE